MEDYLKQFVHKFREEANSLLSQLEGELLELEADQATREHLETIFRVMHTLKGTAGMYGFENIQNLTHHLETVYDYIRDGSMRINSEILELTLISVDHIKRLLEDEKLQDPENKAKQERLLNHVLNIISTPTQEITPTENQVEVVASNMHTYYIMMRVDQILLDRGISMINIFRDLAEYGKYSVVKSVGEFGLEEDVWGVYYVTEHSDSILSEIFMFIEDQIVWRRIAKANLFDEEDFAAAISKLEKNETNEENAILQRSILEMVEERYKDATADENKDAGVTDEPTELTETKEPEDNAEQIDVVVAKHKNAESSRISVSSTKLDELMHLVTELVTTQSQFSLAIQNEDMRALRDIYERTQKLTKLFRDNTLDIRLVPIGDILIRFKRLVRDLARQLGKKVELVTEGMETELDKSMIDTLAEPLLHLVRNCLDHGIELPSERIEKGKPEVGTIEIIAFHSGGHVFIVIRDDGAGIDHQKIHQKAVEKGIIAKDHKLTDAEVHDLMFKAGFSTAHVISEVSGRGVGMDIVRKKIHDIRGEVEVLSRKNVHTTFTVKLQPTIAIIDTMLVKVQDTYCLIPISDVEVCDQMSQQELHERRHLQTVNYNENPTPFIDLRNKLDLRGGERPSKSKLLYINLQGRRFAVVVDKIIGEHQAVLKPLSEEFQNQKLIASASTLGDGSLAFMLDMNNLYSEVEEKNLEKNT